MNALEINTIRTVFGMFLVRDHGFSQTEALTEVNIILPCKDNVPMCRARYLTVPRIGCTRTVTRAERVGIYLSFENAMNHGSVI